MATDQALTYVAQWTWKPKAEASDEFATWKKRSPAANRATR